jgi:uncharacterized protein (TIGR02145 family)
MNYLTDIWDEIVTWCHGGIEVITYGALYNWYAATDVRDICSAGWHVPTITEFKTLADYLGAGGNYTSNIVGGKLKEIGTTYWHSPNTGATNEVGFNSRGGGGRSSLNGSFNGMTYSTEYNSSTAFGAESSCHALLTAYSATLTCRSDAGLGNRTGSCIRPLKDSTTLTHGQTGTYTDPSGYIYRTKCIGTQEWVVDNIKTQHYRNGDPIPEVTDAGAWAALITGALCAYNNDWDNV